MVDKEIRLNGRYVDCFRLLLSKVQRRAGVNGKVRTMIDGDETTKSYLHGLIL
jgi:hypothetical protein